MSLDDGDFDMQPLNLVKYVRVTDWGSNHLVMTKRPQIAVKIAQSIAFWSEIETLLGMFLAFLLHANETAILAMYGTVENRSAQLRMIEAAAGATLPSEHADIITVLIRLYVRPAMKYRDRLAHWCWGFTEEMPEALLIRDPGIHRAGFALSLKGQAERGYAAPIPADHSEIFVVREPDLDRYLMQLGELELKLRLAMATVWVASTPEERAEHLQTLSSEPRIQAGLAKLQKDHQKNPDTQQQSPPLDQSGGT